MFCVTNLNLWFKLEFVMFMMKQESGQCQDSFWLDKAKLIQKSNGSNNIIFHIFHKADMWKFDHACHSGYFVKMNLFLLNEEFAC